MKLAHRVSWEMSRGVIPFGLCVLHRCDNPPCVNPVHLFLGTRADNNADMAAKGRARAGVRRGESNGNAKLSSELVMGARSRWKGGEPQSSIARSLGVSRQTIWKLVHGVAWRHVD